MERLLLSNGHFIRLHRSHHRVRALLLSNGIIEKVFERNPRGLPGIKNVDLQNKYVLPGFVDGHTHLVARGIELQRICLEKCNSLDQCLDKLRSAVRSARPIIFACNWDESSWKSFHFEKLNRSALDKISRKKPIIMRRVCGHCAVVNSTALSMIPRHWTIVDRKTGYLYEDVALNLNDIFPPDGNMLKRAIILGSKEALRKGITTVHEIGDIGRLRLLQTAKGKGDLKIRIALYILSRSINQVCKTHLQTGFGDDYLKVGGIKIFLDGSIGAKTAALSNPYKGTRIKGKILMSMRKFHNLYQKAINHDLQLMVHTIGDRTTRQVLKVFHNKIPSDNPLRHRLEHIEIASDNSIRRIAKLNLVASMQPNFVRRWQQAGGMYDQYLGKHYQHLNCFGKLKKVGAKIVFGSDCMPFGPLYGLPGAFNHPCPDCRITRKAALKMYTQNGAYPTFDEKKKGKIESGMLADLVVLNDNPLKTVTWDRLKVLMTIVNGRIVYQRGTRV